MNFGLKIIGVSAVQNMLRDYKNYGKAGQVQYVVGTNVEYAPYVEFGTSRMSAQPYLRPAGEEVQRNVTQYVTGSNSIEEAVQRAAFEVETRAKQKCPVDTGRLKASITAVPQ